MSGVRVGSRLEQLLRLQRQLEHEIAQERRRVATATADHQTRTGEKPKRPDRAAHTDQLLEQLGVTTREVRTWAIETGLVPGVTRGRLKRTVIEAYAHAHNGEAAAP